MDFARRQFAEGTQHYCNNLELIAEGLEVQTVAEALGEKMVVDVDARLNGAAEVGEHKTSMLQDLELGRPMEVDAIVSAVVELARVTETETPYLDALDGMIRLLGSKRLVL